MIAPSALPALVLAQFAAGIRLRGITLSA